MPFFEWLRSNSERYLLEAAQHDMAARYGIEAPAPRGSVFWRRIFTPLYRLLPWGLRRAIMSAMPGSHRRWMRRAPP
ncbi:MAG TPA: hypothetical protein VG993_02320 [Actinomycetota bacterium]|nr:hypothetical protein [Actinomycetota bacterium]